MIGGASETNSASMPSKTPGPGVSSPTHENGTNGIPRGTDISSVIFLYSSKVIGDGGSGSGAGFSTFVYMQRHGTFSCPYSCVTSSLET